MATNRALSTADRLQPLVLLGSVGAGLAFAAVAPAAARSLSVVVPAGVFALILLVMLGVDTRRVASAFTNRRFLAIAIGVNFIANPVLAWVLGRVFLADQPDLRIGLLLFLLTPCIGWYLIFTELAGGDAALGVGLLVVNLVLQILLLPLYLLVFEGKTSAIDIGLIAQSVALFLVAPAVVAGLCRRASRRRPGGIESLNGAVAKVHLKTLVLVGVIVAMFASEAETLFDNPGVVGRLVAPMVVFFAVAFGGALLAGRLARLPYDQTALLAFTTTSRNSEASLAIAATAFASPLVGLAVVVGPIIELPLLIMMVRVLLGLRDHQPHDRSGFAEGAMTSSAD